MAVGDGALAAGGRDHGDPRCLGQLHEGLFRVRSRHAAAGKYQRKTGLGDNTGGLPQLIRARHDARDGRRIPQLDLFPLDGGFRRDLDQDRTRPAGSHLPECLGHGPRDLSGPERPPLPLGDGAHHIGLIEDLVDTPEVLADLAAGNLAGDDEHR